MDKKEKAKDEIRSMTQEMLLAIKVVKVAMDTGDEGGNLLIETLIEELQKMLPQQKRQNPPKPKIIIGPSVPEQYVGTELIQAEPAWRITDPSGYQYIQAKSVGPFWAGGSSVEAGYLIVHEDGSESWKSKKGFKAMYRRCNGMDFGQAIEAAKNGQKISRKGWNGRHQYVELATNISYKSCRNEIINADHSAIGNAALAFVGTSGVQLGWLASQADMLANDWYIVGEPASCFKPDAEAYKSTHDCCGCVKKECSNE